MNNKKNMNNKKISSCRICNTSEFSSILDLGLQSFTGVFVHHGLSVEKAPLELIKCDNCGLFQLAHDFNPEMMYGDSYGYRSSQNTWMVNHLKNSVIEMSKNLNDDDLVIEIGSNDATSLSFFPDTCRKIGVDPSAKPLRDKYLKGCQLIPEFFTSSVVKNILSNHGKARVIMSFAMFYDLPDPVEFAKNISKILGEDGIWVFEQSYLLSMLEAGSFDTICHEHLEYYTLKDVERILSLAGLRVIDVSLNESNGGSFKVTATHQHGNLKTSENVELFRNNEMRDHNRKLLEDFLTKVNNVKKYVRVLLSDCQKKGLTVYGIGASTKGNVLLQYCNLTKADIKAVGEINSEKFGKECPGTGIPIIKESEVLSDPNGVFLILPWHFRDFFINSNKFNLKRIVFPLPKWEEINV
ncbi:methyltransferase domain-containing protein [Candidatus Woesearchaeota archaeon]|jgi:hypothetical protein|nr:methyltransferase domain-containing protein [Candidatus Woesearchaeota archaeon]